MDADDPILGMSDGAPMPSLTESPKCGLCGDPLRPGEENFHGRAGPCPARTILPGRTVIEERWGWWHPTAGLRFPNVNTRSPRPEQPWDYQSMHAISRDDDEVVRVTIIYTVPESK